MPSRIAFPKNAEPIAPLYVRPGSIVDIELSDKQPLRLAFYCDTDDRGTEVGLLDASVELTELEGSGFKTSNLAGVSFLGEIKEADGEQDAATFDPSVPPAHIILSHYVLAKHR